MHQIKQLLVKFDKPFLYSVSGSFSGALGVILGPFILNKLNLDKFGILSLPLSVFTFFIAAIDFGMMAHLTARYSKKENNVTQEISNCVLLKLLLFICCFLAYLIYYRFSLHPLQAKKLLGIYLISLFFLSTHIEWYYLCIKSIYTIIIARLINSCIYLCLILIWYICFSSIYGIPVCLILSQSAAFIFLLIKGNLFRKLFQLPLFSFRETLSLFIKLSPVAGVSLLTPFFITSGMLLLARMQIEHHLIGVYSIPQRIIIGWVTLITPLVLFFIPEVTNKKRLDLFRISGFSLIMSVIGYGIGIIIIYVYLFFSQTGLSYFSFSLKIYGILMTGIFLVLLRTKYVSAFFHSGRYVMYFTVNLLAASPVILVLTVIKISITPFQVALLACLPELLITGIFVGEYYLFRHRNNRNGQAGEAQDERGIDD
jgi:O-antigen/teichoic acid export membrane protein